MQEMTLTLSGRTFFCRINKRGQYKECRRSILFKSPYLSSARRIGNISFPLCDFYNFHNRQHCSIVNFMGDYLFFTFSLCFYTITENELINCE